MSGPFELRPGRPGDLRETFGLSISVSGYRPSPTPEEIEGDWQRWRDLIEFNAALPGCYWIAEDEEGVVGYVHGVEFEGMEELTELAVCERARGQGIARALLEHCWPKPPTPELGRLAIAMGGNADLSLYTTFGAMPIVGHWAMIQTSKGYKERRSHETDPTERSIVALSPDKALAEWKRLEPEAIGHPRGALHEFFARDRTCLAMLGSDGQAEALCWVSSHADIGPAVAVSSEALPDVVLAALDRVATTQEPENLNIFVTTISWWLLRRLRLLGFRVEWPNWIMCSEPLPGLDRYLPTYPAHLL
ncbi:MAG: GNAT family N-acetyltransferase [Thermoleophilaceae bacterium]|nr:GNAT family N-acetyltransferase [Thermoleophilaceae bacterium]